MKETKTIKGLMALAALIVFMALLTGGVEAERGQYAVLARARGNVEYQAVGTTKWVTASERMRINQGDKLKTGGNAEVVLKISDRNFVVVRENSEFTLTANAVRSVPDPNNRVLGLFPARTRVLDAEVDLARGRSVSVMRGLRGSSNYRLRTPIATAGVRGTVFLAEVLSRAEAARGEKQAGGNNQVVNFACSEGSISLSANIPGIVGLPALLNAGQSISLIQGAGGGYSGDVSNITPGSSTNLQSTAADVTQNLSDVTSDPFNTNPFLQQRSGGYHYY